MVKIKYELQNFRNVYLDEYTREPIPHRLVQQAIVEELNYFNGRVWELSEAENLMQDSDAKAIRTRWVMTNKGDHANPDVRARLAAQDINTYKRDDMFRVDAST